MLRKKLTIILLILGLFLPLAYVSAGTVLSSHKYAWSNNVGYINFENVIVEDDALSGHAWSTNKGLINFSPAQGGVLNDGIGNLSGFAWGEQLGWIDFDNVSINSATGKFSGTATGTLVGTITFDCPNYCDVQTDWRQTTTTSSLSHSGGGSLPRVNITPANLNTPAIPSNVSLNTGLFPPVNSPQGAFIANDNTPPLFDIISSPVQPTAGQQNAILPIALSVVAGVLISASVLFVINKIKIYKIAKGNIKNENI